MSILNNKIDFTAVISVTNANPNGDPLDGNRPRTTYTGVGEISDVCIKRKIRNRLQDMGENIFVQMQERCDDGYDSLNKRFDNEIVKKFKKEERAKSACEKWIDVRSFGQVFAFKSDDKDNVSIGVRGPVSIHQSQSINAVDITSMQITKSVNGDSTKDGGKASDTMGTKHFVNFGLYVIKGSINVQLAEKTGFTEEDAEKIKEALRTLFVNDSSSARPDGSMEVVKLFWWKHSNKIGQYSSAKVHRLVDIKLKEDIDIPVSVDDYDIVLNKLEDLECEVIEGV